MALDIIAEFIDGSKVAQLTGVSLGGYISNGTGLITGAPVTLARGANAVTGITKTGTLLITMPSGSSASAASNGATIANTPVACPAGATTAINITALGAGTITVTVTVAATTDIIEIVGLRTIQAVIGASLSGGYKLDPAAVSIAGNKVTIQPMYYAYNSGAGADGVAINVPTSVDLSAVLCNLTVIGY
jgi:hypothetical protein